MGKANKLPKYIILPPQQEQSHMAAKVPTLDQTAMTMQNQMANIANLGLEIQNGSLKDSAIQIKEASGLDKTMKPPNQMNSIDYSPTGGVINVRPTPPSKSNSMSRDQEVENNNTDHQT